MNILPLALLCCISLPCGLSQGDQPPAAAAPVFFQIKQEQPAAAPNAPAAPVLDQSTPFNAARLLLQALQDETDWSKDNKYQKLPATSPFVGPLKLKSILARLESVQSYVAGAPPERPPFVDEASVEIQDNLALAFIMLPDKTNPYVYAATAVALVKKGDEWKASLTPGSFDNTFLPFDEAIRNKAEEMTTASKNKIFTLARQYSVSSVKKAMEQIKKFRADNIKGKSEDELLNMITRTLKENDPANIAAFLVTPYYMESAITQSARLTPIVKSMRFQDRNQPDRYIQPTYLSFMTYPNVILVPLQPHEDDKKDASKKDDDADNDANKADGKSRRSMAAMTILPPRMSMPDREKPAFIYRYTLENFKDPTDGHTVFKMNLGDAMESWRMKDDDTTIKRIVADFHKTYPALAFATPEEAITAAANALDTQDSLTLIRMLAPARFASVKEFEEALTQLKEMLNKFENRPRAKKILAKLSAASPKEPDQTGMRSAYITKDDAIKATIEFNNANRGPITKINVYLTRTDKGWMLTGTDDKNPLDVNPPAAKQEQPAAGNDRK